jgi:hypothetical protein
MSLYVYVGGNPVNLHDPAGRQGKGGLTISPNSKISAKQWVEMIQRDTHLTPWMKSVFKAEGNSIVLVTEKLRQVPQNEMVPEWFRPALFAIQVNEWHLTTGMTILKKTKETSSAGDKLIADAEPGDEPGGVGLTEGKGLILGETIASESMKVMDKTTNFARKMSDASAGGGPRSALRRPAGNNKPAEGLIVISNRGRATKDSGDIVNRTEASMLETLFHELAAHAGPDSQGKNSEHSKLTDWHIAPITDSDDTAKAVWEFFGKPAEALTAIPADESKRTGNKTVASPNFAVNVPGKLNVTGIAFFYTVDKTVARSRTGY